jgi:hypothetical protein
VEVWAREKQAKEAQIQAELARIDQQKAEDLTRREAEDTKRLDDYRKCAVNLTRTIMNKIAQNEEVKTETIFDEPLETEIAVPRPHRLFRPIDPTY